MILSHVRPTRRLPIGKYHIQYQSRKGGPVSFAGLVDSPFRDETTSTESYPTSDAGEDLGQHAANQLRLPIPLPRRSRRPDGVDRKLENLFLSAQNRHDTDQFYRFPSPGGSVSAGNAFEALSDMLDKRKHTPEDLWAQFEEVARTSAWKTSSVQSVDEKATDLVFLGLLLRICQVRSREPFRQSLPAPAKIIRTYLKHGLMKYWWDQILWLQLGALVRWSRAQHHKSPTGEVPAHENTNRLVENILEVWEVFIEVHGSEIKRPNIHIDPPDLMDCNTSMPTSMTTTQRVSIGWQGLPTRADIKSLSAQAPTASLHRFLHFLPNNINDRKAIRVAGAAELTRDCIQFFAKEDLITKSVIEFAEPFLDLMKHIFQGKKLYTPTAVACLGEQGIPLATANTICSRWVSTTPVTGSEMVSKEEASSSQVPRFAHIMSKLDQKRLRYCSEQIHEAYQTMNPSILHELWLTFKAIPKSKNPEDPELAALYLRLIMISFFLRQLHLATEVWNYMIKSGHHPNQKHWNAMLSGCARNHDLPSLQGIWSNMKAAGLKPDTYAWSTWIGGLLRCRQWQQGLQALEELGNSCKHFSPSDSKPTSEINTLLLPSLNAAISACLAKGKHELVPRLLQWAKSLSVPLNTRTFNTLLKPLVRESDHAATDSLLLSMEDHGCAPDIITVTTILNGLLQSPSSNFPALSSKAQHDAILTILCKLETLGLPATEKTYCTLLDGLLSHQNPNIFAAYAVLTYMADRQLKPSSSIYTIIVTHYFGLQPPDLGSVDALWQRMRSEQAHRDHLFFDRMIEGYARFGEVEKMLAMLRNGLAEGKTPGWTALAAMLTALTEGKEWRLLSDLVADLFDQENGILRHGEFKKKGRNDFWALVDQLAAEGRIQIPVAHLQLQQLSTATEQPEEKTKPSMSADDMPKKST